MRFISRISDSDSDYYYYYYYLLFAITIISATILFSSYLRILELLVLLVLVLSFSSTTSTSTSTTSTSSTSTHGIGGCLLYSRARGRYYALLVATSSMQYQYYMYIIQLQNIVIYTNKYKYQQLIQNVTFCNEEIIVGQLIKHDPIIKYEEIKNIKILNLFVGYDLSSSSSIIKHINLLI